MHPADTKMVEDGDMFSNRKKQNILIRKIAPVIFGFGKDKRLRPDILVEDGMIYLRMA